ncbi:hypothetical protein LX16_3729 [Stackebrandtia albiflava]|uniref:Uncharacterized protein n=1 Tax=Stackebrandtia albiflava TaxID=406432 RepID=A0A562V556_9ACTN|nr:hypothetical protein [Stackebrandtia albiflava]TWJ12962.1 hypothetical protein LX16_3729 [Stackebrandtia albiflava]
MGWNTGAAFVSSVTEEVALTAVGLTSDPAEWVSADEATGAFATDVVFTSRCGDWTEIWDPELRVTARMLEKSTPVHSGGLLAVVLSSVSSTYGFAWFQNGEAVRRAVFQDGEPVVSAGAALPVEAEIPIPSWGPDEDYVFAVVRKLTGWDYDPDRRYRRHALPPR